MDTTTPAKKHFFALVFFILITVLAGSGFLGLVYFAYSKKASLSELGAERATLWRDEAYYRGLKRTLADTEETRGVLDTYLVHQDTFVPFVEEMESLGTHAGVALTVENAAPSSDNRTLTLTMSVGGSFEDIAYFLSLLEAFPAKVSFREARILKNTPDKSGRAPKTPWGGSFIVIFASR